MENGTQVIIKIYGVYGTTQFGHHYICTDDPNLDGQHPELEHYGKKYVWTYTHKDGKIIEYIEPRTGVWSFPLGVPIHAITSRGLIECILWPVKEDVINVCSNSPVLDGGNKDDNRGMEYGFRIVPGEVGKISSMMIMGFQRIESGKIEKPKRIFLTVGVDYV